MESPVIQLLVLAGIAVFLILRLKSVLGTREGFEKPIAPPAERPSKRPEFEVIEGGPDQDITDYVPEGSAQAEDLAVRDFVQGARGAYEMILMAFERGELDDIQPYLAPDVFDSFVTAVAHREDQGLTIEADFIGVRETTLTDTSYDSVTGEAQITMRFVAEMTSVVRNSAGEIVEGDPKAIKRQKDTWVFGRTMGSSDPNWFLVATDA